MEFEYNFGQTTLSHGIKKNKAVYASVPGVVFPLSSEELVFMNKNTSENHVMTNQVMHALSLCEYFKPIDQHVLTISQQMPELSNQVQAIEKVVDFLIQNKLLIEDKQWKQSLLQTSQQNSIKSSGIVIRTCDRPNQLNRMLQSLVKYQNKFNVSFPVQVYDDSSSEKLEAELEQICQNFKSSLSINFYGNAWQTQFIQMIKKEFSNDSVIIDWLLSPKPEIFSGGRIWNLALLNNAGKKFLFFDDDYIFEPRTKVDPSNVIDFYDRPDLSVGFALNLSDIRESTKEYNHDILTQMLNSCGQTIGNWLSTSQVETTSLENMNIFSLERINSNSVIKTTCNGTWGSPRTNSNYWLYFLDGEQKQEFWETRETYLDNIEASNLAHYSQNHEALSLTKFAPSAIDNSTLMPFVMPINRIEDHFFNTVTLFCYPDQISLHFPVMMGHIQANKRDRSSSNHIARKPNFNNFIADYAMTLEGSTDAIDPSLRLKMLAKYVMGLADSSDQNIHNRLKEYLSQIRSDMVLTMQEQLSKSPDAPVYWQADVRELIEANGKAVIDNKPPVLQEWPDDLSVDGCISQARVELTEVAKAMDIWPKIWSFCQTNK